MLLAQKSNVLRQKERRETVGVPFYSILSTKKIDINAAPKALGMALM
jgi:hypothetical protein